MNRLKYVLISFLLIFLLSIVCSLFIKENINSGYILWMGIKIVCISLLITSFIFKNLIFKICAITTITFNAVYLIQLFLTDMFFLSLNPYNSDFYYFWGNILGRNNCVFRKVFEFHLIYFLLFLSFYISNLIYLIREILKKA